MFVILSPPRRPRPPPTHPGQSSHSFCIFPLSLLPRSRCMGSWMLLSTLGGGRGGYPLLLPHLFSTNSSRFTIPPYMEYLSLHPYNSSVVLTVVFSFMIHPHLPCSNFPSSNIKVARLVFCLRSNNLIPAITPSDWIEDCIANERQLRLHGHVTRFPEVNSAHRVVSINDSFQWKRSRGRPHST